MTSEREEVRIGEVIADNSEIFVEMPEGVIPLFGDNFLVNFQVTEALTSQFTYDALNSNLQITKKEGNGLMQFTQKAS